MAGLVHKDDMYETPDPLKDELEKWTGLKFQLDASANDDNKICLYYISETEDALKIDWVLKDKKFTYITYTVPVFNNPPRSKNGKFVRKAVEQWKKHNMDIVQLLCWNDLGNKYGEKYLLPYILSGEFKVKNLGKIIFNKNGKPSKYPSRLTYMAVWMQKQAYPARLIPHFTPTILSNI